MSGARSSGRKCCEDSCLRTGRNLRRLSEAELESLADPSRRIAGDDLDHGEDRDACHDQAEPEGKEARGGDGRDVEQRRVREQALGCEEGGAVGVPLGTADEFQAHGGISRSITEGGAGGGGPSNRVRGRGSLTDGRPGYAASRRSCGGNPRTVGSAR